MARNGFSRWAKGREKAFGEGQCNDQERTALVLRKSRSVMMATLRDQEPIFRRAIDKAMLLIDPPRPPAAQLAPQRLRFADALKG
jgi:hypothetical protein